MKIFISEGSRNAAHNLDDLSERWHLRKETNWQDGYEITLPKEMPHIPDMATAHKFRADLNYFHEKIKQQRRMERGEGKRSELLQQLNAVIHLQGLTRARIIELSAPQHRSEQDKMITRQMQTLGKIVRAERLLVHENENEFILVFPTLKQSIVVKKG